MDITHPLVSQTSSAIQKGFDFNKTLARHSARCAQVRICELAGDLDLELQFSSSQ
jgi:hypothetical protein